MFAEMQSGKRNLVNFSGKETFMSDEVKKDAVSRRGFLGMGSVALAAGMLSADAAAQEQHPYLKKGDRSSSAPGARQSAARGPESRFFPAAFKRRGRGAGV
jgi:hypothetical protein